jgi:hypothetical protein
MKKALFPETVTVRLNEKQLSWLRQEAEVREVWVSDVLRELIAERLGE